MSCLTAHEREDSHLQDHMQRPRLCLPWLQLGLLALELHLEILQHISEAAVILP